MTPSFPESPLNLFTKTTRFRVGICFSTGFLVLFLSLGFLTGCKEDGKSEDGTPVSLVEVQDEPSGGHCPYGGIRVDSGPDLNGNGILDPGEVEDSRYECDGPPPGLGTLVYIGDQITDGLIDLFQTQSDGSGVIKVDGPPSPSYYYPPYEISPDRSFLAYAVLSGTQLDLYTAAMDGGQPAVNVSVKYSHNVNSRTLGISPDSSRMAFMADPDDDGVYDLYTSFPDGTGTVRVSGPLAAGREVISFKWAPDSSRIAYLADENSDNVYELFTIFPDGAGKVAVSENLGSGGSVQNGPLSLGSYEWAPDTSRIAYIADQDTPGILELYTVEPGGLYNTKVSGSGDVLRFEWAPDNSRISYVVDPYPSFVSELFTVFPDGTGNTKVSAVSDVADTTWAPDSSKIAFKGLDAAWELYTVNPDGSGHLKVSEPLVSGGEVNYVKWAPDSSRVGYMADRDTDNIFQLFTVFPDGTGHVRVSADFIAGGSVVPFEQWEWAPDSSRIAYTPLQEAIGIPSYEVYTVFPDGSGHTKVSGTPVEAWLVNGFQWSPDSGRIAYKASVDTNYVWELYTVLPDGTDTIKISGVSVEGGDVLSFKW